MAFISVIVPRPSLYTRYMLHGLGRVEEDARFREQLRLMTAILLAEWSSTEPDLSGVVGDVFDVVTSAQFYEHGYAKTVGFGNDERLWFCSYVGFERVTSEWARRHHPSCKGYICMRIYNQDARHIEMAAHTIQIYF